MSTIPRRESAGTSPLGVYELAAGAQIEDGDIVCLTAEGKAVEGADATGLTVAGVAVRVSLDDGTVEVRDGIVGLDLASEAAPQRADRGKPVYVVGPTEVATESTHAVCAGYLVDVHDGEAFVDLRPGAAAAALAGATAGAAAGKDAIDEELELAGSISGAIDEAVAAPGQMRLVEAPESASAAGRKGDFAFDATSVYLCVNENAWVKGTLALDTWT